MHVSSKKLAVAATLLASAAAAPPALAVPITYTLGGDLSETINMSNGLTASVTLNTDNFTVDLTPNVPEEVFFDKGGSVQFEAQSNAAGSGTLSPTLTITSPAASPSSHFLTQTISLSQTLGSPPFVPASNSVSLLTGTTVEYDLGSYTLSVTPLDDSRPGQEGLTAIFSNSAEFLLTPVPEPAGAILTLAGGALLLARWRPRA